ncbi:MAG TPA: hypothetical protein VFM68_02600 [Candidatus Saccharimonadales bacterium]|nr:hypothetical protein [Candidatus Saccharimonadales bacterium]
MTTKPFDVQYPNNPDDTDVKELHFTVYRDPQNPEMTVFYFDRKINVTGGMMQFLMNKRDGTLGWNSYGATTFTPTAELIDLANKLKDVSGVIVDRDSRSIDIAFYYVKFHKTLAISDQVFESNVITVIAEFFGVNLKKVFVSMGNPRQVSAIIAQHWQHGLPQGLKKKDKKTPTKGEQPSEK